MATWKKVIVSGSNISQLFNDAGYITTVTAQHAFTTASFNGTNLLADSSQGTLNFASSSGQGLTISANAGSDTLTFGLAAIPNASLLNSSITVGGTSINLGGTATTVTGLTLTNAVASGSFSGSFYGDGSNLTGIVATGTSLQNAITNGEGIAPFSYTNIAPVSVAVSGAVDLTNNAITKWDNTANKFQNSSLTDNGTTITGNTSIQLTGANSTLTGSFSGSFFGNGSGLTGIASTLAVSGSTGNGTVALQTQALTIAGTANEVETSVSGQTVTIGLPNDVIIGNNLTVTNDLIVNGTATYINTQNLYVEDPFVLLASGSAGNNGSDGGIVIDRGGYSAGNVAIAYDKQVVRWGFQNGLADNVTDVTLADGTGTSAAFAGLVFTEAAHGATKPVTGEFAVQGAIYTATNEDIWIYS